MLWIAVISWAVVARAAEDTSSHWKGNPVGAAAFSDLAAEDRRGSGRPDLWREFYPGGALKAIRFDPSGKAGRPTLSFYFSGTGELTQIVEESESSGKPIHRTEIHSEAGGMRIVDRWSDPDASGRFGLQESRIPLPNGKTRIVLQGEGLNASWVEGPEASARVVDNALSVCLRQSGDATVAAPDFQSALAGLGGRVAVQPDCNGGFGPGSTQDSVRQHVTQLLNTGLTCLKTIGGLGAQMADGLIATALTPAGTPPNERKPLTVGCRLPAGTESSGSGETAAVSEKFSDCDYPAVYYNSAGMGKYAEETMFHEMLHEGAIHGAQCLHDYDRAGDLELVEPCAAACAHGQATMTGDKIHDDSLRLCRGDFKNNPAQHALVYAKTQLAKGYPQIAAAELRKAVMWDPQNRDAWMYLAISLSKLPAKPERDMRILASLEQVARLTPDPKQKQIIRESIVYQEAKSRVFGDTDGANPILDRYFNGHVPNEETQRLAIDFFTGRSLALMALSSCGPIREYNDGKGGPDAPYNLDWSAGETRSTDPARYPNCGKAFVMAYRSMYSPANEMSLRAPAGRTPEQVAQPLAGEMGWLRDTYQQLASGKSYEEVWRARTQQDRDACFQQNRNRPDPRPAQSELVAQPGCPAPQRESFDHFVQGRCEAASSRNDRIYSSDP